MEAAKSMLRPTTPADTETLVAHAAATKFFYSNELETLREVLEDYHAEAIAEGHRAFTWMDDANAAGFAYIAPVPMTDRTWELWWIVVDPAKQGRGLGGKLLKSAEQAVALQGGRLLLIDTSGLPKYEPTRRFYLKYGYTLCAEIPDFYRDGDAKCVYWKRL
jgi:ribosomal protein S18 acetylase RimI-like enzyme